MSKIPVIIDCDPGVDDCYALALANSNPNYKIVAITMDITHILVDESINEGDKVELISNTHHLESISEHIKGATEEAICALNDRVPRVYINE